MLLADVSLPIRISEQNRICSHVLSLLIKSKSATSTQTEVERRCQFKHNSSLKALFLSPVKSFSFFLFACTSFQQLTMHCSSFSLKQTSHSSSWQGNCRLSNLYSSNSSSVLQLWRESQHTAADMINKYVKTSDIASSWFLTRSNQLRVVSDSHHQVNHNLYILINFKLKISIPGVYQNTC